MGYYTRFSMEVSDKGDEIEDFMNGFENDEFNCHLCYDGMNEWAPEEEGKWYEHEIDIKALSTRFPDVLFTLKGAGEDTGDIWVKYFKDGKAQESRAVISFEPFDETKLR